MTSVVGIQCRALSSRLPLKAFLDFEGRPMLSYMFDSMLSRFSPNSLALLTTNHFSDDITVHLAPRDVRVIRGSEDDVRSRYVTLAEKTGSDFIVRLTADNPFVRPHLVETAIEFARVNRLDYVSNKLGGWVPKGFDVEVISKRALFYECKANQNSLVKEHVTPEIRRMAMTGRISGGAIIYEGPDISFPLSIDTPDEYIQARQALLNGNTALAKGSIDDFFQFRVVS